jgi:hypothetical protein
VQRATLREAMQVSYETADELHVQARGFRSVLVISTSVLSVMAIVICVVGAIKPAAIPLCLSEPRGASVVLSLNQLPSGALTGVVGLLLVRGEFIPGLVHTGQPGPDPGPGGPARLRSTW